MKPYQDGAWPPKAYKNADFLNSPAARKVRVLCELSEPEDRFHQQNIEDTIVLFGSARTLHPEEAQARLKAVEAKRAATPKPSPADERALRMAQIGVKSAPYYQAAMELAAEMTRWSMSLKGHKRRFIICSGGGPGIMEAANRGARSVGGASIGLGISLPHEQGLNEYITHQLQFEFHYFFVRKFWFMHLAKALVAFPGGFGTMDELFETLTLIQTRKVTPPIPLVLFGGAFWNDIINFQAYADWGVISPEDLQLYRIYDSVTEARDYLIQELTERYLT